MRAQKRSEAVDALLEETGLGRGRARFVQIEENDKINPIIRVIESICEQIRTEIELIQEKV